MFSALNDIKLKTKLVFLCGALITMTWISVAIGVNKMQLIGDEIKRVAERDIPLTAVAFEISNYQLEQTKYFERVVRYGEELETRPESLALFNREKKAFNALSEKIRGDIKKAKTIAENVQQHAANDEQNTAFERMDGRLKAIESGYVNYEKLTNNIFNALEKNDLEQALHLVDGVEAEEDKFNSQLAALLKEIEKFTEEATMTAENEEASASTLLMIVGIVATILAFMLAQPIVASISKGISLAVESAHRIADGNLAQAIPTGGKDESGQLLAALEDMRSHLRNMVSEMSDSSSQLATAAEELATVTGETNQNIHTQTGEIDQAVTAINEMAATIQEVAKNASDTSGIAADAQRSTEEGQSVVQNTVSSINDLATEIDNASDVVNRLELDSESISGILDVIKNIAEQTNLLALNAAIEAARAGEQGRGFAVVADEVRTLASRTQESTQEIEEMIEKLQKGSRNAVSAMSSSKKNADISVEQANKAGDALKTITEFVSTISDMNAQIASAAEEQAVVTEEINQNIAKVNDITARTADGADETNAASDELARLATGMNSLIGKFRV
ncbi:MAG TPA: methyl-accepting chemotaxis protein [Gammaproteobacteria bacterium]|nr:methyl-accepting chemotaxis protein [Gammaproteobacteria bacterium]